MDLALVAWQRCEWDLQTGPADLGKNGTEMRFITVMCRAHVVFRSISAEYNPPMGADLEGRPTNKDPCRI